MILQMLFQDAHSHWDVWVTWGHLSVGVVLPLLLVSSTAWSVSNNPSREDTKLEQPVTSLIKIIKMK